MKRIAVFSAFALVIGAVVLRVLQHDTGYVLIAIAGKTVEMRFWFAVFVLIVCGWALLTAVRFFLKLISAFTNGWSLAMASKARRGAAKTSLGFIQFIEGDWLSAQKTLLKAAKDVDEPLVHYLGAARSAYETGNFNQAEILIEKAKKIAPKNQESIAIGQARMLFLNARYQDCLSILHGVKTALPHHPVILDLLYKSYLVLKDWSSLELLLPSLEKNTHLSEVEFKELQVLTYVKLLDGVSLSCEKIPALDLSATKIGESLDREVSAQKSLLPVVPDPVEIIWKRVPKPLKSAPDVVASYVRLLQRQQRDDESENVLRRVLKKKWSAILIDLYGLGAPRDVKGQLRTAQSWLAEHDQCAALYLTLGRISLRCELWGQAKDYFIQAIRLQASPIAYAELARLQASMGELEQSKKSYQQGLLLATGALPTLPLPQS